MNANKSWDSIADRLSRILHYNNKSMTKTQYYQIDDSLEAIDTGDYKKAKDILFNIVHYHNKNLNKDVYFELDEILDDITTLYSGLGDGEEESLSEDTIKQGNAWVNKGKEGTHGKFRTKKEADAQRKAMFANKRKDATFGEELNESAYEDFMNEIRSTDEYHKISKILERAYKALSNEEYKKVYAEAQKVKKEIMAAHINESFEDRVAENDKISNVKDASDIGDWVSEGYVYTFDYKGDTYYVKITRDFNKWSISKLINKTKKTEYKFNKSNWGDKFFKDTFSIEFLRRDEDNWKPLSNTPSHRSDHLSDSLHTKHREGLKESSDYGVCKKCGKKLIPGENYYTMSTEKVCMDCGNKPDYSRLKPARKSVSGDYEDKILARQELELGESRQNNEFYRGEVIWNYGDEDTFEVGFEGKPREFPSKEDAKKAIDEYRKDPHYLSKYERDYYSGPEEGGYTSTGLILIDSKRYPDYDSAVRALEVKQADYTEDELEYVGNDIFEDSYGYVYNVEHDKGSEHSPAKSWAEAELGEDFVARQADEVLEGAVGNLSDKEVDKLLGTLRKAKKLLGVNRIEDIYYVQSEDDPEDWQRELEFTKENINSKVDFFNSKKYNISVVREKLDNGSVALYFADEDSVNRYHDITGNYYDDNFNYSV